MSFLYPCISKKGITLTSSEGLSQTSVGGMIYHWLWWNHSSTTCHLLCHAQPSAHPYCLWYVNLIVFNAFISSVAHSSQFLREKTQSFPWMARRTSFPQKSSAWQHTLAAICSAKPVTSCPRWDLSVRVSYCILSSANVVAGTHTEPPSLRSPHAVISFEDPVNVFPAAFYAKQLSPQLVTWLVVSSADHWHSSSQLTRGRSSPKQLSTWPPCVFILSLDGHWRMFWASKVSKHHPYIFLSLHWLDLTAGCSRSPSLFLSQWHHKTRWPEARSSRGPRKACDGLRHYAFQSDHGPCWKHIPPALIGSPPFPPPLLPLPPYALTEQIIQMGRDMEDQSCHLGPRICWMFEKVLSG